MQTQHHATTNPTSKLAAAPCFIRPQAAGAVVTFQTWFCHVSLSRAPDFPALRLAGALCHRCRCSHRLAALTLVPPSGKAQNCLLARKTCKRASRSSANGKNPRASMPTEGVNPRSCAPAHQCMLAHRP